MDRLYKEALNSGDFEKPWKLYFKSLLFVSYFRHLVPYEFNDFYIRQKMN